MRMPEDRQNLGQISFLGIKNYPCDFSVTRGALADCFVSWILEVPSDIAWTHCNDAWNLLKNSFGTPETTRS